MATTITFAYPDKDTAAALGYLVVTQSQLDYILKMTFKSLKGISIQEALQHTDKKTGEKLRKEILALAKEKLIEGEALELLMGLIDRAWQAAVKRNTFVHNVWGRLNHFEDGLMLQTDDYNWRRAPFADEIRDLTHEISNILVTLNEARFGVIAEALTANSSSITPDSVS